MIMNFKQLRHELFLVIEWNLIYPIKMELFETPNALNQNPFIQMQHNRIPDE